MKKQLKNRSGRILIILIMATSLYFLIQIEASSVAIFYWGLLLFMIVNFWLHIRQEKKSNYKYFFLALVVMIIFFTISLFSLIGWLVQKPMFQGYWAKIFGWPSFVASILITIYALGLFDKSLRKSMWEWIINKINTLTS